MPKMVLAGPLQKLDLRDQRRFQPPAVLHLCRRQTRSPSSALRLRQVGERAVGDLQPFELLQQLDPRRGREPVSSARRLYQPIAVVVPEDQRVEALATDRVAADDELLTAVD